MDSPELWDALRDQGIGADDPDVRAAVRGCLDDLQAIRNRAGLHSARRCAEAIQAALVYELRHPATGDMSGFEAEFDEDDAE